MIVYLSGGAGGKEAAQTAADSGCQMIGCLLAFQPGIVKILQYAEDIMEKHKLRIYLAGAEGYLPTCRQVRGKNFGLLCSFFTCSVFQLKKMGKAMGIWK